MSGPGGPEVVRAQAWRNAFTVQGLAGDAPVALFTAHRVDPEATRAAGFRAIIAKPFAVDAFVAQIEALLGAPG